MSEFYKELKELRLERKITLEEINNRTKISLEALKSIESGQFNQLPHTYLRLFIRAYATEIGADTELILSHLEKDLDDDSFSIKLNIDSIEKPQEHSTSNDYEKKQLNTIDDDQLPAKKSAKTSAKNIRSDMIKGITLIFILIFSIYIIRKINSEEAVKAPIILPSNYEEEGPVTKQILQSDFDILTESKQMMEAKSPFTLKIATSEKIWYGYTIDTLKYTDHVLPPGDNRQYAFTDSISVLFKHSKGLNLYLNGFSLNSFDSESYPLRLIISTINKTVIIQQFTPNS